ncbi:MAG: hypothetical protein K2M17_05795, partial [Bacilli bacterium]|nr:hypothetical protein [Bacilli bacterium]
VLDMMGNTSVASYKPDKLDKKGAETISLTPNSTRQAKSLTLTGQATDTKSGIVKYQITMSSIEPRTGWKTAATPQKLVTDTLDVNKNGTYYFWVIDAAGNRDKVSYNVSNIDNEGPKLVDPGTAFPEEPQGVIIPPNYTDPSGPVSYYYRVQENDPSRPNPEDPSQWSTSRNFRTSCGNNYYVWIKAVDALGNYTLTYVGNYPSKDCCNERNRLNSTCDYPGYYTDYYRNECNGKTWTERSNDPCNWETPIGEEDERCVGDDLRIEWEECYGGRCDIRTRTKYDHPKCYTPSEPQRPSGGKSCGKVCVGDYLCDEVDESDCSCGHIDRSRNCDGSSSNSGSNNGGNNGGSSDKDKGIQAVPKCSDSSYLSGYYSYQCYPYKEGVGYQIGGKWNNFTDACWKGVGLGHYNYLCYYCENSQYPTFYTSSEAYPMCR